MTAMFTPLFTCELVQVIFQFSPVLVTS
jgi:hypothetical protein